MLFETIKADLRRQVSANYGNGLGFWIRVIGKSISSPAVHVTVLFRISHVLYRNPLTRPLSFIVRGMTVVWGGTEIHPSAEIGPGFHLVHSQKVIIGPGVTIGCNVKVAHGVSIGGDKGPVAPGSRQGFPVIGDNATVSMDSIVVGPVTVGEGAFIAVQSLVIRDVPARTMVRGSPATVFRHLDESGVPIPVPDDVRSKGDVQELA